MNPNYLAGRWDLAVIGGGITGAGIFREAVRMGLRTLLVESRDFAWGTSSRSSKLVHGGLRYLKEGRVGMTLTSVRERERLLREAAGLVEPLVFLMPLYKNRKPGKLLLSAGLSIYSLMAGGRQHEYRECKSFSDLVPVVRQAGLAGGFKFMDARVDDARLVLRLIGEAVEAGGCALNYTTALEIRRNAGGRVSGLTLADTVTGGEKAVPCEAVINATGVRAENLHPFPNSKHRIRPLRGSHLILPAEKLPIDHAVSFPHPADSRPVYAIPWEGAVLFGTTDVDHAGDLSVEPAITGDEVAYLADGLQYAFPALDISPEDCISTTAGIRPVIGSGKKDPSGESREHAVWTDKGLVTVTGGKLTTFRKVAADALRAVKPFVRKSAGIKRREPVFDQVEKKTGIGREISRPDLLRLYGRYGRHASNLLANAEPDDLSRIPGTKTLWAELPFVAKNERVGRLSDLMLRRVRVGLLVPRGGAEHMPRIRKLCEPFLAWDEKRWDDEIALYFKNLREVYSLPEDGNCQSNTRLSGC